MAETRNPPSSNNEDRISRLPDELVHYIFSFIDANYAVQTSVLSKRWIGIWKSLPFLNFDRSTFPYGNVHDERFIYFVDMVFILRNDSEIQRFCFRWSRFDDEDSAKKNINRWIVAAVRRNVQVVSTCWEGYPSDYEIPHQLLNCKSLRMLKMRVMYFYDDVCAEIILPKSLDLPLLKFLWLGGFPISNLELLSKRLLSSCPLLKTLHMVDCDIGLGDNNQPSFTVDSLSLERFRYSHNINRPLRSQDHAMVNIIKLCAPNLREFSFGSSIAHGYSLENCSPLSIVNFNMSLDEGGGGYENAETYLTLSSEEKEVYAKRMMSFLRAVHTVEDLKLSSGFLEVLSQAVDISDCRHPRLCNLQSLAVDMRFTRGCFHSIAYLLNISPNIEDISLTSKESWALANIGDDWETGLSLPGMLSHLKSVSIQEVHGCDNELKLLSFLFKNAKVLEKVALYPCFGINSPDRVRKLFLDKLRELPRASSHIIV